MHNIEYDRARLRKDSAPMRNQIDRIQKEFAHFGFTDAPMTRAQIGAALVAGLDQSQVFDLGCDVLACPDHTFDELLEAYTED